MSGPDVARWERFLVSKGLLTRLGSGVFDEATGTATRAFQMASGIEAVGHVDAVTLARAVTEGLLDKALDVEALDKPPPKRLDWTVFVPLMVAVIGGLSTAAVSILNARSSSESSLATERERLRSSIILQAIRTDNPQQALANLKFFAQLGFIQLDPEQVQQLERQPASVPVLPSEAPRRLSMAERDGLVGRPEIRRQEPGSPVVELDEAWMNANIVTVEIPQLRRVPTIGGEAFSGHVRFHKAAAPALRAAFEEIEQRGLLGDIRSFDGAFAPRVIRGGLATLSPHALGIAIDFNIATNPFGRAPAPEGTPGSLLRVAPIFEKHGFFWGGRSPRPEGNHFEFADRARLGQPNN